MKKNCTHSGAGNGNGDDSEGSNRDGFHGGSGDYNCTGEIELDRKKRILEMERIIAEVNTQFPDDISLIAFLLEILLAEGLLLCHCAVPCFELNGRQIKCSNCKQLLWLTADTLLAYKKKPRAWFIAILLKENHVIIGSPTLGKHLQVSQSTAFEIIHTLQMVVGSEANENELLVSSRRFLEIYNKRSSETSARKHPCNEQIELDLSQVGEKNCSTELNLNTCENSSLREELLDLLSQEKISFDAICEKLKFSTGEILSALTELEIDQKIISHFGDCFSKKVEDSKSDDEELLREFPPDLVDSLVMFVINLITEVLGGISRKNVQHFLNHIWLIQDHARWPKYSLLRRCLKHKPIHRSDIRNYVSPRLVRLNTAFCPCFFEIKR